MPQKIKDFDSVLLEAMSIHLEGGGEHTVICHYYYNNKAIPWSTCFHAINKMLPHYIT